MPQYLTSKDIIASAKKRAMIPESQVTFQTEDFLRFANEELSLAIIPYIQSFQEDYLLTVEDVPMVSFQSNYSIPYRATGNKLKELSFIDSSGNIFEMSRIPVDDLPYYQGIAVTNQFKYYYLQHDEIFLVPALGSQLSGTLRFIYYQQPNRLVEEKRIATIKSIDTNTGIITVDKVPANFDSAELYDFIKTKSPHKIIDFDVPISSLDTAAKTITFTPADLPTGLSVGDNVALAGETMIPQIPSDLHSMLAHRVAVRCLEALGDTQGLQSAMTKLAEMEERGSHLIDNRVEAAPFKVVNRHGPLRSGLYRRRRWTFY